MQWTTGTNFAVRHTMNSSNLVKQQVLELQQQQQQYIYTLHSSMYEYILIVRHEVA